MSPKAEIVWLLEERHFAFLVERHAFYSTVRYSRNGIDYDEVLIENDDYEYFGEHALDYEQD